MSNDSFKCPYCKEVFPIIMRYQNKGTSNCFYFDINRIDYNSCCFLNEHYQVLIKKCPSCGEETLIIKDYKHSDDYFPGQYNIKPNSFHNSYPDYVPESIRQDYEEACSILHLSPKAAATLARRCLQGIIRDFWEISKKRLVDEIDALNGKIPVAQWKAIDALRSLGNIGAHMEKDVNTIIDIDEGEAEKLIKLIELLIEQWYVDRHEQEELYSKLIDINEQKQEERKSAQQSGAT